MTELKPEYLRRLKKLLKNSEYITVKDFSREFFVIKPATKKFNAVKIMRKERE